MSRRHIYRLAGLFLIAGILTAACGPNKGLLRSGKEDAANYNTVKTKTPFEEDMDAMRTAGFAFIYVLRRKDGGKIDAEDRGVIKLQTVDTKRRVATDDDRAFLIGSDSQLPPKNLAALYNRFAVETYSVAPSANLNANTNTNTNANTTPVK